LQTRPHALRMILSREALPFPRGFHFGMSLP
jgi:hypothetical protein